MNLDDGGKFPPTSRTWPGDVLHGLFYVCVYVMASDMAKMNPKNEHHKSQFLFCLFFLQLSLSNRSSPTHEFSQIASTNSDSISQCVRFIGISKLEANVGRQLKNQGRVSHGMSRCVLFCVIL